MLVGTATLLLGIVSLTVPVRQVETRMDAVSGSMSSKTVWLFGVTSSPRVEISPLEIRLKKSGIEWTPSWQFLHNTHTNIFGSATCRECGSTPLIYELRSVQPEFATAATDSQLNEFVRVMKSGTDDEQKAAVEKAVNTLLHGD